MCSETVLSISCLWCHLTRPLPSSLPARELLHVGRVGHPRASLPQADSSTVPHGCASCHRLMFCYKCPLEHDYRQPPCYLLLAVPALTSLPKLLSAKVHRGSKSVMNGCRFSSSAVGLSLGSMARHFSFIKSLAVADSTTSSGTGGRLLCWPTWETLN